MVAPPGTETDEQLLARAVGELARRTSFPVAFGGFEHDGAVHVTAVVGTRTRSLDGLVVEAARGLGGQALVEKRPRLAVDYGSSRNITHDYDRAVLGEGISTLFAVPVMVRGAARGILYCGSWSQSPIGDLVTRPAFTVAGELGTELHVREEVAATRSRRCRARRRHPRSRRRRVSSCARAMRSCAASRRRSTIRASGRA